MMRVHKKRWATLWVAALLGVSLLAAGPLHAQETGGRICVSAFNDANRNSLRDSIEPLLADVVVSLYNDQGVVIASYATDGVSEPFCFSGLEAGTYTVGFSGGLVEATGPEAFPVTLAAGQLVPAQVLYGASPVDAAALVPQAVIQEPASSSGGAGDTVRLVLAIGGAGMIMVLMAGLGLVIYLVRYRRN